MGIQARLVKSSEQTDVQATTFSVDGLSRFVCNTWEEVQNARGGHDFDVVIVGSGMYGGYLAAKLFEFGEKLEDASARPRILVLESGPFLITQHVQNLPRLGALDRVVLRPLLDPARVGPLGQNRSFVPHHRCVGGKSLFWGGWTPRLTDDDFAKDWPQEVVDYMKFQAPPGQFKTDGYQAVEQENGTWPVADFIRGALFEILRARASEVLSGPSKPGNLLQTPAIKATTQRAWDDFKANAKQTTWGGLSDEQKKALFEKLQQEIGRDLDAPPNYSPLNPPSGCWGTHRGLGCSPWISSAACRFFSTLSAARRSERRGVTLTRKTRTPGCSSCPTPKSFGWRRAKQSSAR
jgi:hypothetical protein